MGIAVSGGPDSLALLLLAHAALPGRVEAATIDHNLRPDSAAEAQAVADLCDRLSIPHRIVSVELATGNIQAQARAVRYAALIDWAAERGLAALATGHHADDQAETLLMRLNRASGLSGLAGIRAASTVPGSSLPLLRPLLAWRKTELVAVCDSCGMSPFTDPSNLDVRYDRAAIRRNFADAQWIDPAALARSAELMADADDYIRHQVQARYAAAVSQSGNCFRYHPSTSAFENMEVTALILQKFGNYPNRADVRQMVDRLHGGAHASLVGVLAKPIANENRIIWQFSPEPPRKAGEI